MPFNAPYSKRARILAAAFALLGMKALGADEPATTASSSTLHWAYASYFGTGAYQLGPDQSVFVINTAPLWKEGDPTWEILGDRPAHFRLRVPITVGLASIEFDDVSDIIDLGNLSITGVGLGADLDIQLSDQWSVRPNVQLSHGRIIGTPDYAWTYRTDIRARYQFDLGPVSTSIIGAIGLVGYEPGRGEADAFVFTELGAEFEIPLTWLGEEHKNQRLMPYFKYTQLPETIEVQTAYDTTDKTNNLIDVGIAFGKKDGPLAWKFIELDRIGLAAAVSPTSELKGIKLVFESLYEP